MDIFYINCFSHSLYLSRARNISCFSCFLTIIYAIYMPKLNTSGGKGKIKKTQGDTLKAKESGTGCRGDAYTTEFIPGDSFSGGSYNFLSFYFKETHAWFCADYFCISYGVEICPCRCGIPGIRNM